MPPEPNEMFLSRTTCGLQEMTVDSDGCVESFMISVTLLTICSAMCLPDGQVGRRDQGLLPHCVIGPLRGISLPAIGRGSFLLGCWIRTERWRTRTRCCAVNKEVRGGNGESWAWPGNADTRVGGGEEGACVCVCVCVCVWTYETVWISHSKAFSWVSKQWQWRLKPIRYRG